MEKLLSELLTLNSPPVIVSLYFLDIYYLIQGIKQHIGRPNLFAVYVLEAQKLPVECDRIRYIIPQNKPDLPEMNDHSGRREVMVWVLP